MFQMYRHLAQIYDMNHQDHQDMVMVFLSSYAHPISIFLRLN